MSSWWNKPAAKYHGLINHGETDYLNSVLQVLFMTEEFREAVIRLTSPSEAYIDLHLKGLFEELLQQRANPYNILRSLEVNNVHEQQDAAEYFERILRKTSGNAAKIFHGRLSHRTTCSKCKVPTDTEGPFWHLPLELEDSPGGNYSVENGIKMFFTQTIFSGDNQIYCEICDAKVDATREYVITDHPDVLLLMLKRFDFSYQCMSYIKIHCNADVPHTIRIPENQTYELYAVVEHSGDLRGGHYQAIIKSKDEDQWFVFDDRSVTPLGINPFPDNVNVAPSISAYLLFYRKKVADIPISDPCSVTDYNPNIIQDQSPKEENLQPGDETETLDENISDKEGKTDHISTETKPEKREINGPEEIDPDEERLPEEQTGRERQSERLSQDETKYPQDITMEDEEEQEENRHQISGEDQNQGLVGEPEPIICRNMQTDMNYDVDSAEPAASERQKNLWEQQGSPEDRTEEMKRKQETENSNKLITTSEEADADEAENNKLLPTGNMRHNHNEAERAAENELEENKQIGEEVSHSTENLSPQDPDSKGFSQISQSLLTPDEPNIDDNHQMRSEMTDDASKTQTQETEDVDETHVHRDRPKVDDGGESKQMDEQSQIRGKRNRSDQGKKENQDNADRTGEDEVAAYSDSPQHYYDEERTVDMQKKHTKQNVHTSHDTQNKLELKKTRKNTDYKMAATLTGNQEADRDEETRQENFQSYRNKGSEDAEVRRQGSNQAVLERKTIEEDIREFSPGGKGKTQLMIKTITEEIKVVNNSNNRKTISDEGNVDRDLEDGVLLSAKEETTILSEPLLLEQQNPTSKEITRGAKEDEYRLNISSDTHLEAQQARHDMKKKRSCRCSCVIL